MKNRLKIFKKLTLKRKKIEVFTVIIRNICIKQKKHKNVAQYKKGLQQYNKCSTNTKRGTKNLCSDIWRRYLIISLRQYSHKIPYHCLRTITDYRNNKK